MSTPPPAEEIVRYAKDPETKIATITLDRPDRLNAPTVEARLRYADLLHRANIDDDVKVLVVRGIGDDFGSGVDLPDFMAGLDGSPEERLREFKLADDAAEITYPPKGTYRHGGSLGPWFANAQSGCRSLREFQKSACRVTIEFQHLPEVADSRPRIVLCSDGQQAADVVVLR